MTATETASHRCEFPVQPPHGSFADPGPCECGKTCLARIAEQRAAEAGLVAVRPEALDLLEFAWTVIANAGWQDAARSPGWQEAAERWRDRYHAFLPEMLSVTPESER